MWFSLHRPPDRLTVAKGLTAKLPECRSQGVYRPDRYGGIRPPCSAWRLHMLK